MNVENLMKVSGLLARPLTGPIAKALMTGSESRLSARLQAQLEKAFADLSWRIEVEDWTGKTYKMGGKETHWGGEDLKLHIKTVEAGRDLMALDGLAFLERFLAQEVELNSLYMLHDIKLALNLTVINPTHILSNLSSVLAFQDTNRAGVNVSNHYDMPEEAVRRWLDSVHASYSCAIFEDEHDLDRVAMRRIGQGKGDNWDSLEKAQHRKFVDAAEFLDPKPGETTLDVGCGYPGYLRTHMEMFPEAGLIVGWTHSENQVRYGIKMLEGIDSKRYELRQGDYREEFSGVSSVGHMNGAMKKLRKRPRRLFDHIQSTGMISHVGPGKGLVEYVLNCRALIKTGGRMVHHALMKPWNPVPLDFHIGSAFCKKYVWPGFHWYNLGQHVNALQENGFKVVLQRDLSAHYAKTVMAWAERFMANAELIRKELGNEETFRAMQVFLRGVPGGFITGSIQVNRLYCVAV